MTSFEIVPFDFTKDGLTRLATSPEGRLANWPVVYALFNDSEVYVGESLNMRSRADQHSASASKSGLTDLRIILDDTFNKSACLDLESQLIQLFAADAKYAVRNGNRGIVDSAYFDRATYQDTFAEIIEQLRADGYFDRPQQEILQLDTYKYSPFKSPNDDQMLFIRRFLLRLFHQDDVGHQGLNVLEGGPGTGKTIMAVFLMKMIADIKAGRTEEYGPFGPDPEDEREIDVADLHIPPDFSMALVVPQQSLRTTLQKVFDATIGLDKRMVLTPFQVGKSEKQWDLLLVDEAHRLSRRANQPSGPQNKQYKEITLKLFGTDDLQKTQADWIRHRSTNQLLMLDIHQAIRPGDLSAGTVRGLVAEASASGAADRLQTQMRVRAGDDYIRFTRRLFTPGAERLDRDQLGDYELIFFDSLSDMRQEILERE